MVAVKLGVLAVVLAEEERLLLRDGVVDVDKLDVKPEREVLKAELVGVAFKMDVELDVDVVLETIPVDTVVVRAEEVVEPVVVINVDEVAAVEFVQYGTAACSVTKKLENSMSIVRSS